MHNPANGMTVRRVVLVLMALGFGLGLGSCSSSSAYFSDHWPHWAGGEPNGTPPRPGAPGYDDFIAHKQADTEAAKPAAVNDTAGAQTAPSAGPPSNDAAVARGGLY
jgi:hypothetical protein